MDTRFETYKVWQNCWTPCKKNDFFSPLSPKSMLKIPSMLLKRESWVGDFLQLFSNIDLGERGNRVKRSMKNRAVQEVWQKVV